MLKPIQVAFINPSQLKPVESHEIHTNQGLVDPRLHVSLRFTAIGLFGLPGLRGSPPGPCAPARASALALRYRWLGGHDVLRRWGRWGWGGAVASARARACSRSKEVLKLWGAPTRQMVVKMPMKQHERIHAQLSGGIDEPMNRWINESMNRWSRESMRQWNDQERKPWINESMRRWKNQANNQWIKEPDNKPTTVQWSNNSLNQWVSESMVQWSSEPMNQLEAVSG